MAPQSLSGESIIQMILTNELFNENVLQRNKSTGSSRSCWKKKLIFYEFEYWKKFHVRYLFRCYAHLKKCLYKSNWYLV